MVCTRMVLVIVAAAVVVALGLAGAAEGSSVLTVDCQGGVHVLTDTNFELNLEVGFLRDVVNFWGDELLEKAQCACPGATEEEHMRRFVPSVQSLVASFVHEDNGAGGFQLQPEATQNSCAESVDGVTPPFALMNSNFMPSSEAFGLALPSSCTYASVLAGDGCQVTLNGAQNNTWLKDPASRLEVVVDTCPGNRVWPFIQVTCEGPGCDDFLFQECGDDSDCTANQNCTEFFGFDGDIDRFLSEPENDIEFFSPNGECTGRTETYDAILDMLGTVKGPGPAYSELATCGITVIDWVNTTVNLLDKLFNNGDGDCDGDCDGDGDGEDSGILGFLGGVLDVLPLDEPFVTTSVQTEVALGGAAVPGFDEVACAALGCGPGSVGDGVCHPQCNVPQCLFDGNDCINCECLAGSDFSACKRDVFDSFYDTGAGNVFVPFLDGSDIAIIDNYFPAARPDSGACDLDSSGFTVTPTLRLACGDVAEEAGDSWYCTVGIPTGSPDDFMVRADLVQDFCSEPFLPRVRTCRCLKDIDVNGGVCDHFSFPTFEYNFATPATIQSEGLCVGPKPAESCPALRLDTGVADAGLLAPLGIPMASVDKNAEALRRPELLPADTNVLYTTCDGELVVSLFSDYLRLGVSMPFIGTLAEHMQTVLNSLHGCSASSSFDPLSVKAVLGLSFWRPVFWKAVFAADEELSPLGIPDLGITDIGLKLRDTFNTTMEFPGVPDLGVLNLLQGSQGAKFTFAALTDLLGTPIDIGVETRQCASSTLSALSLAVVAPEVEALASAAAACKAGSAPSAVCTTGSAEGAGGPGQCQDVADLVEQVGGYESIDQAFDGVTYAGRNPPPELCSQLDDRDLATTLRQLLLDFLLGPGAAGDAALPVEGLLTGELLVLCLPAFVAGLEEVFQEARYSCDDASGQISFDCEGVTEAECLEDNSGQANRLLCDYDGSVFTEGSEANCLAGRTQGALCSFASCVYTDDPYAQGTYLSRFDSFFENRGEGLVEVGGMVACREQCNGDQFQGPGIGGGAFVCVETAACSALGGFTVTCDTNSLFGNVNVGQNVSTVGAVTTGECPFIFPYAFGTGGIADRCCSDNGGIALASGRLNGELSCDQSSSCPISACTDTLSLLDDSAVLVGDCLEPASAGCIGNNFFDVTTDNGGGNSTANEFHPSVAVCDYRCAVRVAQGELVTCTCAATTLGVCSEPVVTCVEDQGPGTFDAWEELHFPFDEELQTATVVSFLATEDDIPGGFYTEEAPRVVSALFSETGAFILLTFDVPTAQAALAAGSVSCAGISVGAAAALGPLPASAFCFWSAPNVLSVDTGDLLVDLLHEIALRDGNGITNAAGPSKEALGGAVVDWDDGNFVRPTPVVAFSAATVVSNCVDTFDVLAELESGSAGRKVDWSVEVLNGGGGVAVPAVLTSTPLLTFEWQALGLPAGAPYSVRGTATNWLGLTSAPQTFSFEISDDEVPTVSIAGAAAGRAVTFGVDELELQAVTSYECPSKVLTTSFEYQWSVEFAGGGFVPLTGFLRSSFVPLTSDASTWASGPGAYKLQLLGRVVGTSVNSTDTVVVQVSAADVVVALVGGFSRQVVENERFVLSAIRSCDPNQVFGCDPTFGRNGAAFGGGNFGVGGPPPVTWACLSGATGSTPCPAGLDAAIVAALAAAPNDLILDLPADALSPPGLYRFTVSLGSGPVVSSPEVTVSVLPQLAPGCPVVPSVEIAPFGDKVTLSGEGLVLQGFVSGYAPGSLGSGSGAVQLRWLVATSAVNISAFEPVPQSMSRVANREALVLRSSALFPGALYTFRLEASQACDVAVTPSAELSFSVNVAPQQGGISVSAAAGVGSETLFTFVASDFLDPDADGKLEFAFEYIFDLPEGDVASGATFSLSPFSASPVLTTTLEVPPGASEPGASANIYVIAVARDALGAESARNNIVEVTVSNPVNDSGWVPVDFDVAIQGAVSSGGQAEELLRTVLSLASLANTAGALGSAVLATWADDTRDAALAYVQGLSADLQARNDPYLLTLQVNIMLTLLARPAQTEPAFQSASLAFLLDLVNDANTTLAGLSRDAADPANLGIIPSQLQTNVLEGLTSVLQGAVASIEQALADAAAADAGTGTGTGTGDRRRSLQATADAACSVVDATRAAVERLARLALEAYVTGGSARQFQSSGIQFSAAKESLDALGSAAAGGDGLADLSLLGALRRQAKSDGAASGNDEGAGFQLPADVLGGIDFGGATPSVIELIAVSFGFDVRCDVAAAFILVGADGSEDCDEDFTNALTYDGPISEITDVVSLDFYNSDDPDVKYDPTGLADDIVILIPRNPLIDTDGSICNNADFTEISCGFFNATLGVWSTAGCRVVLGTEAPFVDECRCNHASDYSTWRSFTSDVRNTFSNPISAVTAVALLTVGVIFPTLLVIWLLGMAWARRRDELDADNIQKGAIGVMFLNRMKMREEQKRFFANMRAMKEQEEKVADLASYKDIKAKGRKAPTVRSVFGRGVCWNFLLALRYEHSLLGLARFDPHYTRAQRVSVFVAVVMGNLLAASVLYELKTADEISTGFLIGTVLLSSLVVTVPVRIFIKALFRTTANKQDDKFDRVSNIFRVAAKMTDSTPEDPSREVDYELLMAYRALFAAKRTVEVTKFKLKEAKLARKKTAAGAGGASDTSALVAGDVESPAPADSVEALERELREAQGKKADAKNKLAASTQLARSEWKQGPTRDAIERINRVRQQKGVIMKMSALLGDEARTVGRPRTPLLSHFFTYVAWFAIFAFYGASSFYITKFVLTRTDRVGTDAEEKDILLIWLTTAGFGVLLGYLIAEPIVFFIRFAVLPYMLLKCGKVRSPLDDLDDVDDDSSDDGDAAKYVGGVKPDRKKSNAGNRKSTGSVSSEGARKLRYEKNTNWGKSKRQNTESKDQMIWELLSDLAEAGV